MGANHVLSGERPAISNASDTALPVAPAIGAWGASREMVRGHWLQRGRAFVASVPSLCRFRQRTPFSFVPDAAKAPSIRLFAAVGHAQHLAVNIARLPDFARARTRERHKNSCVTKMAGSGVEATQKARAALGGLGPLEPASDRSPGPHG